MSDHADSPSLFEKQRRAFLLKKLHSLTGIVPVGGYMCFHLWENATALQGQDRFTEMVQGINHMPYVWLLEWILILIPLGFHAVYGVALALKGKPNVGHYTYSRNWMYTLQRVTGILAFLFIGYHLWEIWWQKMTGHTTPEQFYSTLCASLSSTMGGVPVIALVYILGIAACVFHFANGLWGFCFSWGITVSRRSQRMAAVVFGVLGIAIFLLGANTAIYFATGSRISIGMAEHGSTGHTCSDIPMQPQASTEH
jgi:succinate dehydrogenase/fumarate reductase cytochrome b subunit (b558 family)